MVNIFESDLRNKVRKEVPFIPGAWVDFYDDTTVQSVQKAQQAKDSQDIKDTLQIVLDQISAWNFSDEKGELPITFESLSKFPLKLVKWITEQQAEILTMVVSDAQKKN